MAWSFLAYIAIGKINKFIQGIIVRERALGLRNFAHLTVVALDDIGRVDYLTDSRSVLKIAAQHLPFVPPRLYDNGVKFSPLILQMV